MTEQEASRKWCPNRELRQNANACCIGSECMAWRWIPDELVAFVAGSKTIVSEGQHGYCGLAGKL